MRGQRVPPKNGVKVLGKASKDYVKQGIDDLPDDVSKDIETFKRTFERFGEAKLVQLGNNSSKKKIDKERSKLKKYIAGNPEEKILLVFAIASHGMQEAGKQVVVIDEYDKRMTFYKWWAIENDIRSISGRHRNSYTIALFGCCREIYSPKSHSGYVKGTLLQALVHFDKTEHQK